MVNIEAFLNSVKASWIKRIIDPCNKGQWRLKYMELLLKLGGEFFFKCNCKYTYIKQFNLNNDFFNQILESWCKINFSEETSILNQPIWNNSNILKQNKPLYYEHWLNKGVIYLQHLVQDKRFLTFTELKGKYNLERKEFLNYHTLISAIPHDWKTKIKDEDFSTETVNKPFLINKVLSLVKPNKLLYNTQIDKLGKNIKAHLKWETHFQEEQINWKEVHKIPFNCTIDAKIRSFQYKFVVRIVANNRYLPLCKKASSNLCDFCNRNIETQIHLFAECEIIQDFWNRLEFFMMQNGWTVRLSKFDKCLGRCCEENTLINFIIIC